MEWLYTLIDQLENDQHHMISIIENEQEKQKKRYEWQEISEKLKIRDKVLVKRTWLKITFH